MFARRFAALAASMVLGIALTGTPAESQPVAPPSRANYPVQLTAPAPVGHLPPQAGRPREIPIHRPTFRPRSGNAADPVVQTSTPTPAAAATVSQWEGQGAGLPGYTVSAVPPDTNMAVGPNHIVQWVNNSVVVFNKQGGQVQAPVTDSTFWGVLSTCYQGGGFSDPIVQYDRAADRWIIGEVAIPLFPGLLGQFAQCFAVSKTSDPTFTSDANGNNTSYYIWAYGFGSDINDYDKISVWPDGYYVTWNIFQNGTDFIGPEACAWNRNDMLRGAAAPAFVCFQLSTAYASLLASDPDGASAPPAGSPNFLMDVDAGSGALHLWRFHVDFATPANSTFTGPISLAGVAPFTAPCPTTQDCIPQPGTTQNLDALGDRLMYRLGYRNLGDHESLVANHTVVTAAGNTGVRWYEVRSPNGAPSIYQQGTFAPDNDNRWMASIAMDRSGDIGIGYTVASGATYPSIRYTGWQAGDTLGSLQAETQIATGGGSQTGYNRWGDYSTMRVDPSDDCTFWYTQEYQATTQSANWNTRIGSFKFSSCGQAATSTTTTLASSANPSSYGQQVVFTATVTPASGSGTPTGTVTFKDGATLLGSAALSGGAASLATATLATGPHSITASYGGDANYLSSVSTAVSQTVNRANTTTVVSSSANPATVGQSVTLTAQVSPSAATGTVTFYDGGNSIGTAAVVAGKASLSTSALSAGAHSITAAYGGDGNYNSSTSAALNETINNLTSTTTALASSANPSVRGQKVTFTATVSAASGSGTPTGTVKFLDGGTSLGTSTLNSSGVATLTATGLSLGSHSITAQYGGSASDNGSTSAVLVQVVNAKK